MAFRVRYIIIIIVVVVVVFTVIIINRASVVRYKVGYCFCYTWNRVAFRRYTVSQSFVYV